MVPVVLENLKPKPYFVAFDELVTTQNPQHCRPHLSVALPLPFSFPRVRLGGLGLKVQGLGCEVYCIHIVML